MSLMQSILLIASALTFIGGLLLILGLRGGRVGDHPFCRRCGFDLFGQPPGSAACPECGADQSVPRTTVIGSRQRRPISVTLGIVLLLIGMMPLGVAGWGAYRGIDWQLYKPVAWLMREAQNDSDLRTQSAALQELLRRQGTGALGSQSVATIVDAGLNVQGDLKRPWNADWGDFIEAAHAAGMTSEPQWKRYAAQAATSGWLSARLTPTKVHAGEEILTSYINDPARVGRGTPFYAVVRAIKTVLDEPGFRSTLGLGTWMPLSSLSNGIEAGASGTHAEYLAPLSPGKHSGYTVVNVRLTDPAAVRAATNPPPPPPPNPSLKPSQNALNFQKWVEADRKAANALLNGTDGSPSYAEVQLQLPIQFELVPVGER